MPLPRTKKRAAAGAAMDARLVDALMTQGIARMAEAFEIEVAEVMRKLARSHRRRILRSRKGTLSDEAVGYGAAINEWCWA